MFIAVTSLETYGIVPSLIGAVGGLGCAFYLIRLILKGSPGNERMRQIAGAIEEGAKAYLKRQVLTISALALGIFVLLFLFKDKPTAIGFVIGAACSLLAGYIGMRIAVLANTRTTQAAMTSTTAALRMAFNGGAVTGMLVVALALLSVGIFFVAVAKMINVETAVKSLVGLALG